MLEGLLSTTGLRPQSLEAATASFTQSKEISERSLTAAFSAEGDDRATRITLSERAFSSLQESRVSFARASEGDEAEDFSRGVDRASRRIGRALERLIGRIERLQDRAEAIGERLSERVRKDIEAGRFDDRTPFRLASKLLREAGRIEQAAERLTDRLGDAFAGAAGETGEGALTIDFSQSISLSVQQVQVEIQDGDESISVSYQKIVFESTTTLGISFAQETPEAADPDDPAGDSLSTVALEEGIFVNAETGQAEAPAGAAAAEEGDPAVPALPDAQPGLTAGQGALLLIQQISFESSSTLFSFDVAARTGPFGQSGLSAAYQSSQFDFSQQTTQLLALSA